MKPRKWTYIVKRGRCVTRFQHALAAYQCWKVLLGSAMYTEDENGIWTPWIMT